MAEILALINKDLLYSVRETFPFYYGQRVTLTKPKLTLNMVKIVNIHKILHSDFYSIEIGMWPLTCGH